jgi:hypothetical protein
MVTAAIVRCSSDGAEIDNVKAVTHLQRAVQSLIELMIIAPWKTRFDRFQ